MKAIRINHFGSADQLKFEDTPRPQINDNQILVEIADAGVNPIDWKIRSNSYNNMDDSDLPLTMGQDFAGTVLKTGQNIVNFKTGDRVFGFTEDGAYAEYGITNENMITKIPADIDFVMAAALPTPGLTAWQIVFDAANIQRDTAVLIQGAAGSVGTFAVQLCRWRNAHVIATAAREDFGYLKEIGADELINYKTERFENRVEDVDVVIDLVGGPITSRSIKVVKRGGIIVNSTHNIKEAETKAQGIRGVNITMQRNADQLKRLVELLERDVIRPRISKIMPLEEAKAAQEAGERGLSHGKIVLQVSEGGLG